MATEDDWGDDEDDWGDDDENMGEEEDGNGWDDLPTGDDEFPDIDMVETVPEKKKEDVPTEWTCLECNVVHQGAPGLICLSCNKINLGELDRLRQIFEKQEASTYFELLMSIYPTWWNHINNDLDLDISNLHSTLETLYTKLPAVGRAEDADNTLTTCTILCEDFDEGEFKAMELNGSCGHRTTCKSCIKLHVESQINSKEDIVPWVVCPAVDCAAQIPLNIILESKVSNEHLYNLAITILSTQLIRNTNFIPCDNSNCVFGFLEFKTFEGEKEVECEVCYTVQKIKREASTDEGFAEMVKQGKVRMCPACQHPAMKDKGICNVLQCTKCYIWWNWATKDTAKRSRALKEKARKTGTLWESGELEYQRNLQKTNIDEFVALLKRNGIEYDPNYVRGSG